MDSPLEAVGIRYSSRRDRMLLQMSCNSFSTCEGGRGGGAMGGDERGGMVMVARERIDVKTLRERGES